MERTEGILRPEQFEKSQDGLCGDDGGRQERPRRLPEWRHFLVEAVYTKFAVWRRYWDVIWRVTVLTKTSWTRMKNGSFKEREREREETFGRTMSQSYLTPV